MAHRETNRNFQLGYIKPDADEGGHNVQIFFTAKHVDADEKGDVNWEAELKYQKCVGTTALYTLKATAKVEYDSEASGDHLQALRHRREKDLE